MSDNDSVITDNYFIYLVFLEHPRLIKKGLLNTQEDLDFLLEMNDKDLEKLVGIVRERVDGQS
jgi:chromosome condensin MukBEF MukE localization factor